MNDITEGLEELLSIDQRLAAVVEYAGDVPLRLQSSGFHGLASIVVSQMISRAAANKIRGRLEGMVGGNMKAASLLHFSEDELRAAGLSGAKARTLLHAAEAVVNGKLDLDEICLADVPTATKQLTSVRGVGPWTAEIYLMFCAGHADIFPVGDIALQNAVAHGLQLDNRPKGPELAEIAALWSPWRSVAARLFWAYYSRRMWRETNVFG